MYESAITASRKSGGTLRPKAGHPKEEVNEMVRMLISWVIITLGILVAAYVIPGVRVASIKDAFIAAAILGVLNVLLKPILVFLSFPITILTLGLFLFVINAFLFWLAGAVLENFEVKSFGAALFGSLTVSIVSAVANMIV
jgi:putative membrane protein